MKVCVIGTRGFPLVEGGVEKHCELLYPQLRKDIEVTVFRRKPYVKSVEQVSGIRFIDLPSTKIKGFETVLHSCLATLHAICMQPDVIHYHNIGPALFSPLARLFRIPIVLTYHSANYEHKKWGVFSRNLLKFSETVALRCAQRIVFVNRFQMEKYPERVQKKSLYIPNGIQQPIFSSNRDFLDSLQIQSGKYILSVGRITPEKGFDTLIKAYQAASPNNCKLVIAGSAGAEKEYLKQLKDMCSDSEVVFAGYVHGDNLAQLYSHAAMYVLASNNEGFPLVLLEAMSYGLDVAVSDIPATRLVRLEENDYFSRGNYSACAKRICEKLSQPQKRVYDLAAFQWDQIGTETSNILEEAVRCSSR